MKEFVLEYAGKCHSAGVIKIMANSFEEAYKKFETKYKNEIDLGNIIFIAMLYITEKIA